MAEATGQPAGGSASLILLTRSPQILVANSGDQGALRTALDEAQVSSGDGDIGQAIALAYSLLRGQADGQIVIIGSGRYRGMGDIPPSFGPVTFIPIASEAVAPNLAICSFSSLVSDLSPVPALNIPVLPEARSAHTDSPLDLWRWLGWLALGVIGLEWWVYRRGY